MLTRCIRFAYLRTYLRFRAGLKRQGILNNDFLPARAWLQPYSAWWVLAWCPILFITRWVVDYRGASTYDDSGYYLMIPGGWNGTNFVFTYGALFIFLFAYILFKLNEVFRQKQHFRIWVPTDDLDCISGVDEIGALTAAHELRRASKDRSKGRKVVNWLF